MKRILFLLALLCLEKTLSAQTPYVYSIKADSVKITNTCDTAELIIENHTQTVPGFLFNKGRGKTEFRRVLTKVDDTIYTIGIDTLKLPVAWLQGGNKFGSTGKFGTLDNNHIDFYTANAKRGRWTNTGNFLLGTEDDNGNKLAVVGITYSQIFTNSPTPLGIGEDGPFRLRWSTAQGGKYITFYYQDRNVVRGFLGAQGATRPLTIFDSNGVTLAGTPFLSVGAEPNQDAILSVTRAPNSPLDVFCAHTPGGASFRPGLTVKKSGNTIIGDSYYDFGDKLQVKGSAYIQDTLKMPNLVSQTDASNYKPLVADANGNVYKMSGWPSAALNIVNGVAADVTAAVGTLTKLPDLAGTGSHSVSLPAASAFAGQKIFIWNKNSSSNSWTFSSSVTWPDGTTNNSIPNQSTIELLSDGTVWIKWK